jgi:hypothetical protein
VRAGGGRAVRFDKKSGVFLGIAAEYRAAIDEAEKLWRKSRWASVRRDPVKADAIRRKLAALEARLDAARGLLFAHVRGVESDRMRADGGHP